MPIQEHLAKDAKLCRFVFGVERDVGTFPVTPNTHTLEAYPLGIDRFQCKLAAFPSNFQRIELLLLLGGAAGGCGNGLHGLELDGEAMSIPARNIDRLSTLLLS